MDEVVTDIFDGDGIRFLKFFIQAISNKLKYRETAPYV